MATVIASPSSLTKLPTKGSTVAAAGAAVLGLAWARRSVGPQARMMEAAEAFANLAGQIGGSAPAIGPLLAYAAMQNQDLPGMEESLTAFRKVLVAQGLLEPKEGEQPPQQQQQPNPKDMADAKKAEAQSGLYAAQAEGQELQNAQMAAQMGAAGLALPGPDGMPPQQMQPPIGSQVPMGGDPQFTGF